MARNRRNSHQIARDRLAIAEMYLQGKLQADIAEELGISQTSVSRDLQAIRKAWMNSAIVNYNEAKAQELAKIDVLEREYWRAWEASKEDAEVVRQKGSPESVNEITKTIKGQTGDPAFLQGIQWCINKRCEIFGLDAPTVIDWRVEATSIGLRPQVLYDELVGSYLDLLESGEVIDG